MDLFRFFRRAVSSSEENVFEDILYNASREMESKDIHYWAVKPKDLDVTETILNLPDKQKVEFILDAIRKICDYHRGRKVYTTSEPGYLHAHLRLMYLSHLFKIKVVLNADDVQRIVNSLLTNKRNAWDDVMRWPIAQFVIQVDRNFKDGDLPEAVKGALQNLKDAIEKLKRSDKETVKIVDKINDVLFRSDNQENAIKPTFFLGNDALAGYANPIIEEQPEHARPVWYRLVALAQKATGSKPTQKYLDQSKELLGEIGGDKFKAVVTDWFDFVVKLKEDVNQHTYTYGNGQTYSYNSYDFLSGPNIETLKGFVWMCSQFHDSKTLGTIASLCERCFKKIPGKGPAAAAIGNACIYTLYKSKGMEGIAHLSRLKLRIKQSATQSLIEKYLESAAKDEGISVAEIEDLAVDDYGLLDGKREFEMEGYKAVLTIQGIGDVHVSWFKPDNTPQKSVPTLIKEKYVEKLSKIRDVVKRIEVSLTAQRDRIDRMFRAQRKMTWKYFDEHYFSHGLLSFITKNIIWKIEKEGISKTSLFLNGSWTTLDGQTLIPDENCTISLWHPASATVGEVRSWRQFLMNEKIAQPLKQAFREVYLLTDAEVNTRIYSNRMAAHLLKQHQFNTLAKTRGWKYSLLGAYDDGRYNEGAQLKFPELNLRAEFWVNEVNANDAFNDVGIWNYVATDQVRFVSTETDQPVELVTVPPIVFSEAMRDVDLFVGVASVGNDPTWQDSGGVPAYRDYWQSYSFGELTEIAKTRKEILENLVPRLKIASVATVKDKFVIVTGKLRTYKIHIGSTNILMEPNDQYLCIVPDQSKKDNTGNLFLPFEGDSALSVIISKAMLLADDDKITDSTITSQINRK